MLRMLIVDDEKIIRETIRDIIDWNSLGITIAGVCKNGLEAYDMILDEYPDIVLTDINMPGLSGLDLIRRITQGSNNTEFVILSGYGDFAYTKQAMRLGINHYLLKPCNETEIIQVMEEVKKRCIKKRLQHEQEKDTYEMLRHLHESLAYNIVVESFSKNPNIEGLQKKYERYLSFTNVGYEVCQISNLSSNMRQKSLEVFSQYHKMHAEPIPFYCLQTTQTLYICFESYDFDYCKLDEAMNKACENNCVRKSFECLNALFPKIQKLASAQKDLYFGLDAKPISTNDKMQETSLINEATDFIQQVQDIVKVNLHNPELSLKYIAENHLYMNVDYVSRKFVKEANCKFSAFLADMRINKAKAMFLADKAISINEVANAVGCGNNPQYFSQLFKKMVGITPTDYIKSVANN